MNESEAESRAGVGQWRHPHQAHRTHQGSRRLPGLAARRGMWLVRSLLSLAVATLAGGTQPQTGEAAPSAPVIEAAAEAQTHAQAQTLPPGTVVALAGTPHLWFADVAGVLHWGGDTRALARRRISWESRVEASLEQIQSMQRGDPWLSAGLLKIGDPIYFVKWETNERQPRLLHILSISDVQLFGIDSDNYHNVIVEQAAWEAQYGFKVADLAKGTLVPATPTSPEAVLLADTFDKPDVGIFPQRSGAPMTYVQGYEAGEYVLRKTDVSSPAGVNVTLPGAYDNASLAVDVRMTADLTGNAIHIACRRQGVSSSQGYVLVVVPNSGRFALQRRDGATYVNLVALQVSPAIATGTASNRIELRCAGSIISAKINGQQVASAQDRTYPEAGRWWINLNSDAGTPAELRLNNLVLTRQ